MYTFVLLCIIGVAIAGRLGYDYQPGLSGRGAVSLRIGSGLNTNSDHGINQGYTYTGSSGSSGFDAPVVDGGLNKEFYLYSAPEEVVQDGDTSQRFISSLKRNLRVVFIKAPENNDLSNAALQLARNINNDRTAIYVLSKQADISELANQVQELREAVHQKPEVRFIKYRTSEDAINAQQAIQQQYDALGGSTRASNEGIAPVLNFSSASQSSEHALRHAGDLGGSVSSSNTSPSGLIGGSAIREYLPPIVY